MRNIIVSKTEMALDEDCVFYCMLSSALRDECTATGLVEFSDRYMNYLDDGFTIDYPILSLISFCHSVNIEPVDIFDGKVDYFVYLPEKQFMHKSIFKFIHPMQIKIIQQNNLLTSSVSRLSAINKLVGITCSKQDEKEKIQSYVKTEIIKINSIKKKSKNNEN